MAGRFGAAAHHRDYRHGRSGSQPQRGRGLIFQTSEDEFYLVGAGYRVLFVEKASPAELLSGLHTNIDFLTRLVNYEVVEEGHLDDDGVFTADRERNGDESSFGIWMAPDFGVAHVVLVD